MEVKKIGNKILDLFRKYKFAALILVLGLFLIGLPQKQNNDEQKNIVQQHDTEVDISDELENILSGIHGAGKVKVFITVAQSEQVLYQTDSDISGQGDSLSQRTTTILVTDVNRNETGLVKQRISAKYQGAIIVCQGADQPAVKLAVTEAVSKATGLGSNKICVLKMK